MCDGQPVYETPPEKYTAERIIHILLDPNIEQSKICEQRPLNIESSCTFVVDLDQLSEADDVKKIILVCGIIADLMIRNFSVDLAQMATLRLAREYYHLMLAGKCFP